MVPPGLPALPLVLYVHEGKTGSSTVRHVLQAAQSACSQDQWLCELSDSSNVTFETCQHSDVVIGPALYGTCSLFRRPCRYFTVMREPVDRLVSSYNYFCLSCKENGKFCWTNVQAERLWNASCPSMSFLEYTAIYANKTCTCTLGTSVGVSCRIMTTCTKASLMKNLWQTLTLLLPEQLSHSRTCCSYKRMSWMGEHGTG